MARAASRSQPTRSGQKSGRDSRSKSSGSSSSGGPRRSSRTSQSGGADARSRQSSNRSAPDLPDYSVIDPHDIDECVDVYVDAPVVKVDEIKFEMDDLRAHLAVLAEAGHFVQINAGAGVRLGKVKLDIQHVETQALLEARLRNVTKILGRVLTTLDRNPELLQSVGEALGAVGGGAHELLGDTGDVIKSVGKGGESAVQEVGRGAGRGVEGLGQGAQRGVEGVGQGTEQGLEGVGQGTQQGLEGAGQGTQQALEGVGRGAQEGLQDLGGAGQQAAGTAKRRA
jgi:hypothetical protein